MKKEKILSYTIKLLAEKQQQPARKTHTVYAPLVTDILENKRRDQGEIEKSLDGLLNFCLIKAFYFYIIHYAGIILN